MQKLEFFNAMQRERPLDPTDFNLKANNSDLFRQSVGSFVSVGYEIEGDTISTADTVRLLAPGPHVDIWEGQELWHSLIYAEMANQNGIDLPELTYKAPERHIKLLGKLVDSSNLAARLFGLVVDIEGFKNEKQNMAAQQRAANLMFNIGENELARAFRSMHRQETLHAGYYREDLKDRRLNHPFVYKLAKSITSLDPKPIGANTPERVLRIGAVMESMFETDELTKLVEKTAGKLDFSPKQIGKQIAAIEDCVQAYQETKS